MLVSDTDADGVSVAVNSLALDGGAIQSTDDSTNATLAHAAATFADHRVDTEVMLLNNLNQADASPLTVSVTERVGLDLSVDPGQGFTINAITLDVRTPSDTLEVTVTLENGHSDEVFTYSGSVTTAGLQTFTYDENVLNWPTICRRAILHHRRRIGAGSIELAANTTLGRDSGGASGIRFVDEEFVRDHIPQLRLVGHVGAPPEIVYGEGISRPENGSAYSAGEHVVVLVAFTHPVDDPEPLRVPLWIGDGAEHPREAQPVSADGDTLFLVTFAYVVGTGDTDTDGIYIAADPFGDNADAGLHI